MLGTAASRASLPPIKTTFGKGRRSPRRGGRAASCHPNGGPPPSARPPDTRLSQITFFVPSCDTPVMYVAVGSRINSRLSQGDCFFSRRGGRCEEKTKKCFCQCLLAFLFSREVFSLLCLAASVQSVSLMKFNNIGNEKRIYFRAAKLFVPGLSSACKPSLLSSCKGSRRFLLFIFYHVK